MRIGEILRKLADIVDQEEPATQQEPVQQEPMAEPVQQEPVQQEPVATVQVTRVAGEMDGDCGCDDSDPVMVSPLQQEHELLKMSQGVDNNVDEFADQEEAGYQDELAAMKQSAGIGEEAANAKAQTEQAEMENSLNPRRNAAIAMHKSRSDRAS